MPWQIVRGPVQLEPSADHHRFLFALRSERGGLTPVFVEFTNAIWASEPGMLPPDVADAVRTSGRSAVEGYLREEEPPRVISISADRVRTVGKPFSLRWPASRRLRHSGA